MIMTISFMDRTTSGREVEKRMREAHSSYRKVVGNVTEDAYLLKA